MREKEKENYEVKKGICDEVEALLAKELTPKEIDGIHNKVQDFMARRELTASTTSVTPI